jgi:hypothetical protein
MSNKNERFHVNELHFELKKVDEHLRKKSTTRNCHINSRRKTIN